MRISKNIVFNARYLNLNTRYYKPHQVASQYDGHDKEYLNEIVRQAVQQSNRYGMFLTHPFLLNGVDFHLTIAFYSCVIFAGCFCFFVALILMI